MIRRLLVGLLVLVIVVGLASSFWSRRAVANTGSERRVMLCVAEPWNEGDWNSATSHPPSDQTLSHPSAKNANSEHIFELQKPKQKPSHSPWFLVKVLLFNLKLLLGGK